MTVSAYSNVSEQQDWSPAVSYVPVVSSPVILATPSSFVDVEIYSIEKTPPRAPKLLDRPSREPEPEPEPEPEIKVCLFVFLAHI